MVSPRFTLVELMVVVAIVGVLAAIALPVMANYQLKAKVAEASMVSVGLSDAATGYAMEHQGEATDFTGSVATWAWGNVGWPRDWKFLDKEAVSWNSAALPPVYRVGFEPSGDVRCQYFLWMGSEWHATADQPAGVTATCDIDDDGERLYQYYAHSVSGGGPMLRGQAMCLDTAGGTRTPDAPDCF